ncbi:MAG: hypothetical protein ACRD29_02170 [Acidimicrobiales bacterium]
MSVSRSSAVDEHHTFARYEWEMVAPDGSVALSGLDVAEVGDDGLLRRVVGSWGRSHPGRLEAHRTDAPP